MRVGAQMICNASPRTSISKPGEPLDGQYAVPKSLESDSQNFPHKICEVVHEIGGSERRGSLQTSHGRSSHAVPAGRPAWKQAMV